ncbi:MAG: hypothetical protein KJ619_01190 [Candidatus Omnitrophica bacterium]|nr:hypothetical protein [Candidatus Omnitrophota bacterium]
MRKIIVILFLLTLAVSGLAYAKEKPTVLVFFSNHCRICLDLKANFFPGLKEKYFGRIDWLELDSSEPDNLRMLQSLSEEFEQAEGTVPTVFLADKLFVGSTEIQANLEGAIQEALVSQIKARPILKKDLKDVFKKFSGLAIAVSGLADGINPCAFAVIVFFISFLAVYGYKRKEIICVGISYCSAVFITYLLIGLGFFEFFYSLSNAALFIKWFYYFVGAFCLLMGALAVYDYINFKLTHKSEGAILQLPKVLKKRINITIGSKLRQKKNDSIFSLVITSFSVGFMVSLLEAACTGQLYIPTIVFVLKSGQHHLKAWGYLLLYNLMFILPLVAVFLLSLAGVGSEKFNQFLKKHVGLIKLILALVFFALGGFILLFN